jgi:hypothetical protein
MPTNYKPQNDHFLPWTENRWDQFSSPSNNTLCQGKTIISLISLLNKNDYSHVSSLGKVISPHCLFYMYIKVWPFRGLATCSSLFSNTRNLYFEVLKNYETKNLEIANDLCYNGAKSQYKLICILGYRKLTKFHKFYSLEMCTVHYKVC